MTECCNWTYDCPEAGVRECIIHGGFDVCCEHVACPMLGRTRRGVLAQVGDGVAATLHERWREARRFEPLFKQVGEEGERVDVASMTFTELPRELQAEPRALGRYAVTVAAYAESLETFVEQMHGERLRLMGQALSPVEDSDELQWAEYVYAGQVARSALGMEAL